MAAVVHERRSQPPPLVADREGNPPLPDGWTKVESRSKKGKVYYFNSSTGESSWEHPLKRSAKKKKKKSKPKKDDADHKDTERGKSGKKQEEVEKKEKKRVSFILPSVADMESSSSNDDTDITTQPPLGPNPDQVPFQYYHQQGDQQFDRLPYMGLEGGYFNGGVQALSCDSHVTLGPPPLVEDPLAYNEVEMEDTERWDETHVVAMDIDVNDQVQQQMVLQVQAARSGGIHTPQAASEDLLTVLGLEDNVSNVVHYQDMLYLVLDTNVLLSHLEFLVELKDCSIKGVGRPVLVVPWVVMQELDGLKVQSGIGDHARKAIQFLHSCFSSQHPRVRGQTMEEVGTELSNVAIENNDDRILHCCLVCSEKVRGVDGIVVLFSNDTQLCSKALVNGVKAVNRKTLLPELRNMCKHLSSDRAATSYAHTTEYAERVTYQVQLEVAKAITDDIICEVESLLRDGLSVVVEQEMKAVYEHMWLDIVAVKPPWTFHNILRLMEKHWIAVFSFIVQPKARDCLQQLLQHMKKKEGNYSSYLLAQSLLENGSDLVHAFSLHSDYSGVLTHCVAAMKVLKRKLSEISQCADPNQDDSESVVSSVHPVAMAPKETLSRLSQRPPASPLEQVPWVLGLIYEGVRVHSENAVQTARQRKKVGGSVQDLRQTLEVIFSQLTQVVAAMTNFLQALPEPSISVSQDVLAAFDSFVNQILGVSSPLTMDVFYSFCQQTDSRSTLQRALAEFNTSADSLQKMALQYFS